MKRQSFILMTAFLIAALLGLLTFFVPNHKQIYSAHNESETGDVAWASAEIPKENEQVTLNPPGGRIDIEFARGSTFNLPRSVYIRWLESAAHAVSAYYRNFPIEHLKIKLSSDNSDDIGFATTGFENGYGIIEIPVGEQIEPTTLDKDWTATHEMTHLAFPLMDTDHKWLAEGQATYIEPLARARIGKYSTKRVWEDLVNHLPEGLPQWGDQGLNNTHTWGRTYWGGALFCLLADIEIRQQTHNRKGLEDAVAAIAQRGGTVASDWDAEEALRVGDRAIGVSVLEDLYAGMKDDAYPVNLQAMWNNLGVKRGINGIEFDNSAPLAEIRLAIERGHS